MKNHTKFKAILQAKFEGPYEVGNYTLGSQWTSFRILAYATAGGGSVITSYQVILFYKLSIVYA